MRVGALFAGLGGFERGFQQSGQPYEIAWQVEIDEWCRRLLAKRFPDAERFPDVRDSGKRNLSPVDVIVGGFPCQDLSTAGLGAGLSGARSGLWFEMLRIIHEMQPKYVVIENVRALVNRGLPVVVAGLVDAGYRVDWCILSAADVGAPHRRERVWIVASRRDVPQRFAPQLTLADAQRFRADVWPRGGDPELWERDVPRAHPTAVKVADRPKRLKGLGNAIVPQIAELIARQLVEPAGIFDRVSLCGGATLPTPTAASYGTNCGIGQAPRMGLESMARNAAWPTPTARAAPACEAELSRRSPSLETEVVSRAWPTPRAEHDSGRHKGKPDTLHSAVKAYPTPTAHLAKETGAPSEADRNEPSLASRFGGRLNPQWVELLMGYPVDWTDPSATVTARPR